MIFMGSARVVVGEPEACAILKLVRAQREIIQNKRVAH